MKKIVLKSLFVAMLMCGVANAAGNIPNPQICSNGAKDCTEGCKYSFTNSTGHAFQCNKAPSSMTNLGLYSSGNLIMKKCTSTNSPTNTMYYCPYSSPF
jgi:hypothetical protein